ncbi:MAG TPA: NAD(P)-dependent alcohol dehydrogenase [Solirubrobacteraceae bacterium]|nr:NAD(P)-dependent alcohol dehydrogenase [Solirubrobacteraceae bacterium]
MKIIAALSASADAPFEIAEVELDDPRSNEVLVQIKAVGVCHSDLTMKAVWPAEISPIVLGHEGAGVVVAVGSDVTATRPGDNVVLSYNSCGACPECSRGYRPYCRNFRIHNGIGTRPDGSSTMRRQGSTVYGSYFGQSSFASHALAYESNVVVVGDDIDLSLAAPLGCGIQTGAGTVLNVLRPAPDATLVVFGAGAVGLSALMAAGAIGVAVIAVDPVAERRALATRLGADAALDPAADDVVGAIHQLTGGGAPYAIDTTAKGAVINQAIAALAPRGTLAVLGIGIPEFALDMRGVISGGKTVRGVIEGDAVPHSFIPQLLALHADGELPIEELIRPYAFEDIDAAFADAASGVAIKPVLLF